MLLLLQNKLLELSLWKKKRLARHGPMHATTWRQRSMSVNKLIKKGTRILPRDRSSVIYTHHFIPDFIRSYSPTATNVYISSYIYILLATDEANRKMSKRNAKIAANMAAAMISTTHACHQ